MSVGGVRKYKIGEIAELAGVSRRTIDYYTGLGLLKPFRSKTNYRYYPEDTVVRLKFIETMKENRLTLDEIKEKIDLLDDHLPDCYQEEQKNGSIKIEFLREQIKLLDERLVQLQEKSDGNEADKLIMQIRLQSVTILQAVLIYIHEITPEIGKFL